MMENIKEKKGTCIKCGKVGYVSDAPNWWHDGLCYECSIEVAEQK